MSMSPDYMRKASADSRVIQVIETRSLVGKGIPPDDPIREVFSYFLLDGTPLAEVDPFMEGDPRDGHSYLNDRSTRRDPRS